MMARNTALYLRIGEAKNLPAKDLSGTSDPYCVIKVDNEQVARTATVWKTLNPFWGEEYTLYLPGGFHQLSIYIYDEDYMSEDDIIGQVTLSRDMIQQEQKGMERWFPVQPTDKDQEVQGQIHLEVGRYTDTNNKHYLKIRVIEARDLAEKDLTGAADPYVRINFLDHTHCVTQKIKCSRFPYWDEVFEYDLPVSLDGQSRVMIQIWDWDRLGHDDFMGQLEIRVTELQVNHTYKQWFDLYPLHLENNLGSNITTDRPPAPSGSLRLRVRLQEERILPTQYYSSLIQLLMDSVQSDMHRILGPSPLKMLQEVMTLDLLEMSNTLVKLYIGQGRAVPYLDFVCTEEIHNTSNPNTLFRGNSLATKSVDQFMKIVGMPYLHETLGSVIEQIYEEQKSVELDPSRLGSIRKKHRLKPMQSDKDLLQQSQEVLLGYLSSIREKITTSVSRMPPIMRLVFRRLRERIEERWPEKSYEEHRYVVVSGFLFLRFLAPAILSPKLFSLHDLHPCSRVSRTLTLLAKVVQNMGNLGLQLGLGKEQFMQPLHTFIVGSVAEIKLFIDAAIDIDASTVDSTKLTRRRSIFHPSVTIKQGYLNKKRWHQNKYLSSFAFKKRYFWLKYDSLCYAKKPSDRVRNVIPVSQICAVERVDRNAFAGRHHLAQVISCGTQDTLEILYIQAKDINEIYSWISSLRKTIINNIGLLNFYHPGAYRSEQWTCCHRSDKQKISGMTCEIPCADGGCNKTHSHATLGDWRDPLDPDAEAQTIYSQLYQGRQALRQKYMDTSEAVREAVAVRESATELEGHHTPICDRPGPANDRLTTNDTMTNSHSSNLLPTSCGQLPKSTSFQDAEIAAVGQLLDVVRDLEKAHEAYDRMEREKKRYSLHPNIDLDDISECSDNDSETCTVTDTMLQAVLS